MNERLFTSPKGPAGLWDQLTTNKKAWIEFIRVISGGRDPKLTLVRVQMLEELLDTG